MILVGGEALYDLVLRGPGDSLQGHAGGGPFNTARTIGRLAQPVGYLGRLSTDRFGQRLEALLAHDGVAVGSVVHTDEPTTLALAEVDREGIARYRFYLDGTAAPGLTPEAAVAALPDGVAMLHVGTLGLAREPVASALEAVVARLSASALVAVDPNCRPQVIADRAAYVDRLRRILARSHLLKLSEDDVRFLEPEAEPVAGVRALLAHGPAVGVLTRGPEGAVAITPTGEVAVPAVPVNVVDTIGAGDAFGGGFLAWWSERGLGADALAELDLVVEATRFACLVSARTCAAPGASPPRRAEL